MNNHKQMSDSLPVCFLLALSGGCMDAYSYLYRGKVFANAQTGNMLLFGINLAQQQLNAALRYLWPILAFIFGIILSDLIRYKAKSKTFHWRLFSVLLEIIALCFACWMPLSLNALSNMLISFVCGLQVETFRSVNGNAIATTMCIGNLRSGTFYLGQYFQTFQSKYLRKASLYYFVIFFFVLGAVLESFLLDIFFEKALLFSVSLLIIVCCLMFFSTNDE